MATDKHNPPAEAQTGKQDDNIKNNCTIPSLHLRAGTTCPYCNTEILDYNGMLQLACPRCGVLETGVFT